MDELTRSASAIARSLCAEQIMLGLVSVVIPAYNAEATLARAIGSALSQDWTPKEIVVVDDGSNDRTRAVAESFGGAVRYIHQPNAGAAAARNRGIQESRGELIAFLDADDEWLAGRLRSCLTPAILSPNVGLIWCWTYHQRLDGRRELFGWDDDRSNPFAQSLWPSGMQQTSATIVGRKAIDTVGGFDPDLKTREDLDLWIRIGEVFETRCVQTPLSIYHERLSSISMTTDITRVKADYLRVIERALARRPERYGSKQLLIGAEADYFCGVWHFTRGDHRWARGYFLQSLRNHLSLRGVAPDDAHPDAAGIHGRTAQAETHRFVTPISDFDFATVFFAQVFGKEICGFQRQKELCRGCVTVADCVGASGCSVIMVSWNAGLIRYWTETLR
jgi:glycosyltransferase involved in cell wall biosynthesis